MQAPSRQIPTCLGTLRIPSMPVWLQGDIMDTAPIRPQPEPQCTNEFCPIKNSHGQGFHGNNEHWPVGRAINESIDPPLDVFDDPRKWAAFSENHVQPLLSNSYLLSHKNRQRCTDEICSIKEPHGQGMYFHDRRRNWLKTEQFQFCNPTPEIWDASHRIENGWGTEEKLEQDREVVEAFIRLHGDDSNRRSEEEINAMFGPA